MFFDRLFYARANSTLSCSWERQFTAISSAWLQFEVEIATGNSKTGLNSSCSTYNCDGFPVTGG